MTPSFYRGNVYNFRGLELCSFSFRPAELMCPFFVETIIIFLCMSSHHYKLFILFFCYLFGGDSQRNETIVLIKYPAATRGYRLVPQVFGTNN
jgi:hypothetical protein